MFIRRKTYNELIAQKDDYEKIAHHTIQLNGRVIESNERILEEMKGVQELNYNLQRRNEELLVRIEQLETELQGAKRYSQQWADDFEELDLAYGRLETDYDRLHEERDHYEERCRYLEGEVADKEELEAKLDFVIKQRDYYYDLLESTSEVEEKDE